MQRMMPVDIGLPFYACFWYLPGRLSGNRAEYEFITEMQDP